MPEKLPEDLDRLARADVGVVRRHEPLRDHCTWRIGGPADLLVEPQRVEQLATALRLLAGTSTPRAVIGSGSNLLFSDAGFRGAVIVLGRALSRLHIDGTRVVAEAGIWAPRLARAALVAGLTGLEHVIGIPGTLGGLIAMNGGSQRRSVGSVVRWVEALDAAGGRVRLSRDECRFAYRSSAFQGSDLTIVRAEMELERGDPKAIRRESLEILRSRRRKFPRREPNCGSVFVSDPAMYERFGPPGKVVEDTGCKGWRVGDARVSSRHANFIVNVGAATAADVLALIGRVRRAVHERTGSWLRCEVKYVSESGRMMPAHEAAQVNRPEARS